MPLAPTVNTSFIAPTERTVQVWRLSLATMAVTEQHLNVSERERAARFRFRQGRRNFVATRSTLRRLLGAALGVEPASVVLEIDVHGKPRLLAPPADTGLRFNVSHAEDWALVALGRDRELGVDLELIRPLPNLRELAQRSLAPGEQHQLDNATADNEAREFLRHWTRKEAVLKAAGVGLGGGMKKTDTTETPLVGGRWRVLELELIPGYVAALAVEGADWELQTFNWHDTH